MPLEAEPPVSLEHAPEQNLFYALGGRDGCHRLASAFYALVPQDPILRPLYPPRITNCPQHALAAFLTQFLGGPCDYGDRRWFGSLRAAHQRFAIGPQERAAWLATMFQAIDDIQTQEPARSALRWVFIQASAYLINQPQEPANAAALPAVPQQTEQPEHEGSLLQQDIAFRWEAHQMLEQVIAAIRHQEADQALRLLESSVLQDHFRRERAAWLNPLALLSKSKQPILLDYVEHQLNRDPTLVAERYMGDRTLLHEIAGQGNVRIVAALLRLGADPNASDGYGQTPLYWVSNAYPYDGAARAAVVATLVQAGANVNMRERVKGCSALHMAARRGNVVVAQALLRCGADIEARDKYGDTPLHRAVKCRQAEMVTFLLASGADAQARSKSGQTPQQMAHGERIQQVLQASNSEAHET
jgi:truncated hemoglobin YjbI